MLEMLLAAHASEDNGLLYTFLREETGPAFSDVVTAADITGGTVRNGTAWLRFKENASGQEWIVAKTPVVYGVTMANLDSLNVFLGKNIAVGGVNYFCRSIGMTKTGSFTSADVANGANATVTSDNFLAMSEFNQMFYPILDITGTSVDGIRFGTSAKYTTTDIGLSYPQDAQIGSERNPQGYHLVLNYVQIGTRRLSRTGSNIGWGWRPMMMVMP